MGIFDSMFKSENKSTWPGMLLNLRHIRALIADSFKRPQLILSILPDVV